MYNQLQHRVQPPQLPKKKMSTMMATLIIGATFFISMPIFIFSIFPITAPMMIGAAAGAVTEHYTGSKTLAVIAGSIAGAASGFLEVISGVGVEALDFLGSLIADALTLVGWILFYTLLVIIRVPLLGSSGASRRRFVTFMTSFIIGLVPILNIIPTLLIGVTLMVISIHMENNANMSKYKKQLKKYNIYMQALQRNTEFQPQYGNKRFARALSV